MAAHALGARSSFGGSIDDFFLSKLALLTLGCEVFAFSYRHLMLSLDIQYELTSLIVHCYLLLHLSGTGLWRLIPPSAASGIRPKL